MTAKKPGIHGLILRDGDPLSLIFPSTRPSDLRRILMEQKGQQEAAIEIDSRGGSIDAAWEMKKVIEEFRLETGMRIVSYTRLAVVAATIPMLACDHRIMYHDGKICIAGPRVPFGLSDPL